MKKILIVPMIHETKRICYRIALACFLFLASFQIGSGHWYGLSHQPEGQIFVDEMRWPVWPPGTYFAIWNTVPVPSGGYLYGGFAIYGPDESARPELVWSFWHSEAYNPERASVASMGPNTYGGPMYGEGATAGVTGHADFMRPNRWYRTIFRSWQDAHDPEQTEGVITEINSACLPLIPLRNDPFFLIVITNTT